MRSHEIESEFLRKVQYYETDMMQIVHHSNYIRWFEEARIQMMDEIGISYSDMENEGIQIPVLSVSADYKKPCVFGETICIISRVTKYNGIRLEVEYEVYNEDKSELRTTGRSSHCFIKKEGFTLINLKKVKPELDEKFICVPRSSTSHQVC